MSPKRKGRKKEQPPLAVQGLLHLEASFVSPVNADVTLATVTPGPLYGYGDGAERGFLPEALQSDDAVATARQPDVNTGRGDSLPEQCQQSSERRPDQCQLTDQLSSECQPDQCQLTDQLTSECQPEQRQLNDQLSSECRPDQCQLTDQLSSEHQRVGTELSPSLPPPDPDDPDQYEPPEFASASREDAGDVPAARDASSATVALEAAPQTDTKVAANDAARQATAGRPPSAAAHSPADGIPPAVPDQPLDSTTGNVTPSGLDNSRDATLLPAPPLRSPTAPPVSTQQVSVSTPDPPAPTPEVVSAPSTAQSVDGVVAKSRCAAIADCDAVGTVDAADCTDVLSKMEDVSPPGQAPMTIHIADVHDADGSKMARSSAVAAVARNTQSSTLAVMEPGPVVQAASSIAMDVEADSSAITAVGQATSAASVVEGANSAATTMEAVNCASLAVEAANSAASAAQAAVSAPTAAETASSAASAVEAANSAVSAVQAAVSAPTAAETAISAASAVEAANSATTAVKASNFTASAVQVPSSAPMAEDMVNSASSTAETANSALSAVEAVNSAPSAVAADTSAATAAEAANSAAMVVETANSAVTDVEAANSASSAVEATSSFTTAVQAVNLGATAVDAANSARPAAEVAPVAAAGSVSETDSAAWVPGLAGPASDLPEQCRVVDSLLEHYWQFVRENPYDFNGWTYLLQHVEKQTNLDAIRAVYNAFLPLYPYCYAYWKKYADLEKRSGYTERSLQILERGVKAIPLSVELWMALLNQLRDKVKGEQTAQQQIRQLCERAVQAAGVQFRSDQLWECYIQWETANGAMSDVTSIYRRLLKIPTRLYNRHWDNFLQHIRDYHPRDTLEHQEYATMRRECCASLGLPHREEPAFEQRELVKTQQPEVKLIAAIKERIVAEMVSCHEETEQKIEKRWKLEEKIKRPYFHVVALDRRQLRAWRDYLELEAADGDHRSLVQLYERCLIACAQYEEFWAQYARYLERRLEAAGAEAGGAPAAVVAESDAAVRRLVAAAAGSAPLAADYETVSSRLPQERHQVAAGRVPQDDPVLAVREVYKRACLVHCPTRPNIRLQWAAFEECSGNINTAVHLINMVIASFPTAVRPRLQLIGLERRRGRTDQCSRLYDETIGAAPDHLRTWWAMKHARFCFKILSKPDKALGILRTAVKRDRANARLYLHILDVCYQRNPVDVRGVNAALTLAINSKELSGRDKLGFRRKRVEFFEEFGSLRQLRTAEDGLAEAERALAATERRQARDQEKEQEQAEAGKEDQEVKNLNAKRRRKVKMDPTPPPPPPPTLTNGSAETTAPLQSCPKCGWDGREPSAQETPQPQPQTQPEPVSYGQVPPTWDLVVKTQTYGYGKDPQYKWFQERGYREYSAKEAGGYPASLLDPVSSDEESLEPPLPKRSRSSDGQPTHIVTRDGRRVPRYVIPPLLPTLRQPVRPLVPQPTEAPGGREPQRPPQLARLPAPQPRDTDAPCVNVPEWLVHEGGELCLSETEHGVSLIRYWPCFMTDKGVKRMFTTLRRCVKWHQTRQVATDGRFVALKRLVAWFGACGLEESGLMMPTNENWPPELLDLLQRLVQFTSQEFNSCHLSLFRTGHDLEDWHTHEQPVLGRQPAIGVVSLGAVRSFELRQKAGGRFLRLPLQPGSLLVMQGSTQHDWLHQVPKDSRVAEERIGLQFRTMYDLREL